MTCPTRRLATGAMLLAMTTTLGMPSSAAEMTHVLGSTLYAPGHNFADSMIRYGEAVAGRAPSVEFEWFYGDALAKPSEMPDSLADGIVNLGYVTPAYSPAEFPTDSWVALLGYGNDPRPVVGLLSAAAAMIEFGFTEPGVIKDLTDKGMYPLIPRFQSWDNYQLLCKEPVKSLADAKGRRVRVGGDAFVRVAKSLGMTPVTLSGAEIYEGLDRGVVDCFIGGEGDMVGLGLWEIAHYYTSLQLPGWNSTAIAMGADFFNGLPEDNKKAFLDSLPDFLNAYFTRYLETQHRFFSEGEQKYGLSVEEPDAEMKAAIKAHYTNIDKVLLDNAPASIKDPAASIARYKQLRDKWTKIVLDLGYDPAVATRPEWVGKNPDGVKIDLKPWVDEVKKQVFDQYLPLKS